MSHDLSSQNDSWIIAVLRAIIWNFIVTIMKFIGFIMSWSWALFAEAIHSFADTMNQVLLFIWIKKSQKKADNNYDYGYWKERFFWAIISACWIFFLWAWITIYHWIEWLINPHIIETSFWIYFILVFAFIVEWVTLYIALKSIYVKELWLVESIKNSDNASLAVILEDSVAMLWVLIAFMSILLTQITKISYFDSIWSIIIWFLLAFVAIFLIIENRRYLLWKAIDEETKDEIIELIQSEPIIKKVMHFKSEALNLNNYVIKCDVEFNWSHLIKEINKNWFLSEKDDYNEFLKFCVDYADRVPRIIWKNIDVLEKKIKTKYPEVKHIDIELN